MVYREMPLMEWYDNIFGRIGEDWMLVTAGTAAACNTMTASWGQMGVLWGKPVATVYVRPQRYTREFLEKENCFSLSFFGQEQQRDALQLLGSKSGRDGDKIAEAGLHVTEFDGVPAFTEARLVLVCKVLYKQDLQGEHFLAPELDEANYPAKDYHRMYVGEITRVYSAMEEVKWEQ